MAPCHSFKRRRSCGGRIVRRPSRTSSQLNINHHQISPSSHPVEAQRPSKKIVRRNSIRRSFNKQFFFFFFFQTICSIYYLSIYKYVFFVHQPDSLLHSIIRRNKKNIHQKIPSKYPSEDYWPPSGIEFQKKKNENSFWHSSTHTHTHTHRHFCERMAVGL